MSNEKESLPIITIIGSCRYLDKMKEIAWEFTRDKWIVMLPNERPGLESLDISSDILEEIGMAKIDLANVVYVCNVDGYIGESTSKELAYARSINKTICYYVKPEEGDENE